jgi:hypothetical protein
MNPDLFIKNLVQDLKPVRAQAGPLALTLIVIPCLFLITLAAAKSLGLRDDLSEMWRDPWFVMTLVCAVSLAFFGVLTSAQLSTPGLKIKTLSRPLLLAAAPFAIYLTRAFLAEEIIEEGLGFFGIKCAEQTLIIAALAFVFLFFGLKKRTSLRPMMTGIIAGFGSLACGWIAIGLICGFDHSAHILIYHLAIPGLFAAVVSTAASRFLTRV